MGRQSLVPIWHMACLSGTVQSSPGTKMRAILLAIGLMSATLSFTPAFGAILISNDNGGLMEDYVRRFGELRRSGETVVIDGTCMSACTMVLGLVPRGRICATDQAVLGFHAAWEVTNAGARVASPAGTRDLMKTYPPAVQAWIARHGGLKPRMMFLHGPALAAIVPQCGKAQRTVAASPLESRRGRQAPREPRRVSAQSR